MSNGGEILEIPAWLLLKTFHVQYSPNCPKQWLVRLIRRGQAKLDGLPYFGSPPPTNDACGFGNSLEEAAENARQIVEAEIQIRL